MHQKQQQSTKVTIIVSDPQVKKQYGGAKIYYLYSIKGQDSKGSIDIHRRYADFDLLKNLLIKRWPGCYIPSLPSKVKLSNSNEQFLQTRSKYLRLFLIQLSKKSYIWSSDQVQLFLRNKTSDFDKCIGNLWKIELSELTYRYVNHFQGLNLDQQQKSQSKIAQFSKYLNTLFIKIQQLRNRSQQLNDSQARYQKKFSKFLLNTLATYQQKFLTYYNEGNNNFNPIFLAKQNLQLKQDLQQSMKEIPLKILFQQIKRQKRQIFSIQQSIKEYQDYTKQKFKVQGKIKDHQLKIVSIQNGNQNLFSKIKNVFTDDDIKSHEKSIEKYKGQLQTYNKLLKIMKSLLARQEIQYFKKERTSSYYKMVQQIAREQLIILEKQRTFWLSVCKNNHIGFQIQEQQPKKQIRSKKSIKENNNQRQNNQSQQNQIKGFTKSVKQIKMEDEDQTIDQIYIAQKSINQVKIQQKKPKSQQKSQKNLVKPLQKQSQKQKQSTNTQQQNQKVQKKEQQQHRSDKNPLKQLKNAHNEIETVPESSKIQKQTENSSKNKIQGSQNDKYQQIDTKQ